MGGGLRLTGHERDLEAPKFVSWRSLVSVPADGSDGIESHVVDGAFNQGRRRVGPRALYDGPADDHP